MMPSARNQRSFPMDRSFRAAKWIGIDPHRSPKKPLSAASGHGEKLIKASWATAIQIEMCQSK